MLAPRSPLPTQLVHGNHAQGLFLTTAGQQLFEESPATIEAFVDTASILSAPLAPMRGTYEHIGSGVTSSVYGMPGEAGLCIKALSPSRMKARWSGSIDTPHPNLGVEVRYMDAVQRHLSRHPDSGVAAPIQYGVATFAHGFASLQQRVPEDFQPIHRLEEDLEVQDTSVLEQAIIASNKTAAALGGSFLLRQAAGELGLDDNIVNPKNYFIDPKKLAVEGKVYVIDLIGISRKKQMLARAATRFMRG